MNSNTFISGLVGVSLAVALVACTAEAPTHETPPGGTPGASPSTGSNASANSSHAPTSSAAPTSSMLSPDVAALLAEIKAADTDLLAVSEEDGRFLRLMAATSGAKHALEIGGANGYSGIWIGLGLRESGGTLTTIEYDPARARSAADHIARAGLSDIVTVIPGDAFAEIPKLQGTFDFVFLDAWKKDYKRFFDLVFPRLEPRGLFLAHNVVNKQSEMGDFLSAIHDNPSVMSTIVSPSGEGMSVTYKLGAAR
jgi:predicted O-methyltransferase YrrM